METRRFYVRISSESTVDVLINKKCIGGKIINQSADGFCIELKNKNRLKEGNKIRIRETVVIDDKSIIIESLLEIKRITKVSNKYQFGCSTIDVYNYYKE